MRRWAWLAPALLPCLVFADERALTLDAPVIEAPRATAAGAQTPLEVLRLDPALPLAPISANAAQLKLAAPVATANAKLPSPLASAQLSPARVEIRAQTKTANAAPESLESAALGASVRFDKALESAGEDGESSVWKLHFGAAETAAYRRARDSSKAAEWKTGREELQAATLAMYASAGVQAEPVMGLNRADKPSPGVRISPVKGAGPLNELAYGLKQNLGVDLDYVPERTQGAVAAFNAKEKRVLAPHLDEPEFFLAVLHEARHAYYSALLAKGDVRLFHLNILARPGRRISPYAEAYATIMSLEELSTYPKSLKHLLTPLRDAPEDEKWQYGALAQTRIRHYLEFLGTLLTTGQQLASAKPRLMTEREASEMGLEPVPGGAWFQLDLPQAVVYMPAAHGDSRSWLQRKLGSPDPLAAAAARLRAKLLAELAEKAMPVAGAYREAIARRDYAEASKQADRLINLTSEADRDWRLSYAALLARGE